MRNSIQAVLTNYLIFIIIALNGILSYCSRQILLWCNTYTMNRVRSIVLFPIYLLLFTAAPALAQTLTLKDAVHTALENYNIIQAKGNYVKASEATLQQNLLAFLPNINISAQNDYGTVNGQTGPSYGLGGLGVSSSGPVLAKQNWNAAFGGLYLANVNWDFFSFGRIRGGIGVARAILERDKKDLEQEKFQHEIRVSSAYLNLLAAQRLRKSQERNLQRALTFKNTATVRAANGLNAGVDSSLAKAEVSSATIALTNARDVEQEQANRLGVLMGITTVNLTLDTASITRIPTQFGPDSLQAKTNPVLSYYRQRIEVSEAQVRLFKKSIFPTFSFFGVMQGRGSGFGPAYSVDQSAFSRSYTDGVNPVRGNYLLGIGLSWNLTTIARSRPLVRAQQYVSRGLQDEYEQVDQQLTAQLALSDAKIVNAVKNYNEAPIQTKAATDAYLQKNTLYKNGLTTIVDLTQALYLLNRAETDRDIAYTNVWQALLLKSAALGDFNVFITEF
jgi:outer membrane protein TolC